MIFRTFQLLSLLLLISGAALAPRAQSKEIAFTIDDLPLNGPSIGLERLRTMTDRILTETRKGNVPMVGFVNEGQLYVPGETDARIEILKRWHTAGVELGNHTFSHLGFKNASLRDFADDFLRGDSVTRIIVKPAKPRYFRHPFLQMGDTGELENEFQKFIAERGYRAVPVTVDTMDWMFLAAYAKALDEKDEALKKRTTEEYLKFIGRRIESAERAAQELFGRPVRHILLLHANELNGDHFAAVVEVFRRRGYRFVTVEEALGDEIYRFPDRYAPTSDWLGHWAASKERKFETPQPPDFVQRIFQGK